MKRFLGLVVLFSLLLCGCKMPTKQEVKPTVQKEEFTRGVWLTFNEINSFIKSENGFRFEFDKAVGKMKELKITDLYFHIRSHCDSVVKSEYFPQTESSKTVDFDILEYAVNACHKENIRLHAWINPYRVSATESNVTALDPKSPAAMWLNDQDPINDRNVYVGTGIYLNPAEREVRELVLNGINEILENYSVDGIHFDDYFYPQCDDNFDKVSFNTYLSSVGTPLSLADWRRANVTALISGIKASLDLRKEKVIFSVSPAADIEKNYNSYYADIIYWAEKGYVDEIIPQLYFGFKHTQGKFQFDNLLEEWKKESQSSRAELKIGLASYKKGISSPSDGEEWVTETDVIERQAAMCEEDPAVSGIVYFSYTSV